MKRLRKYAVSISVFLFGMFVLAGCAKGSKAAQNTLYVEKNGKVTGAIVEDWNKDFYDEDELKKQINSEIDSYEAANDKSSIKLQKFEIEDKKAKVNLLYDSLGTYADFNDVVAFNGTIKQAQEAGFGFEGEFISTGNKPAITINEIDGSEKYKVLILSEKQKIKTEFKILYASNNVKVSKDNKTAVINEDDSAIGYLIYKK